MNPAERLVLPQNLAAAAEGEGRHQTSARCMPGRTGGDPGYRP
jgi:hypothetical protein